MKLNIGKTVKLEYVAPTVEIIELDNSVSLTMESNPPIPDNESHNSLEAPDYFNNDPYKKA